MWCVHWRDRGLGLGESYELELTVSSVGPEPLAP